MIRFIELPSTDFIEACNLLQLKATISCERKLVFDKVQKMATFTAKATSTPIISTRPTAKQHANLDSLISDLEQEESLDYQMKDEQTDESGQVLEVYEISNLDDAEIVYEDGGEEEEEMSEERYELMNVVGDMKTETYEDGQDQKPKMRVKMNLTSSSDMKQRQPTKHVDGATMDKAIKEVLNNSNR